MAVLIMLSILAGQEFTRGEIFSGCISLLIIGWNCFWFYRLLSRTDFRDMQVKMNLLGNYEVKSKSSGSPIKQIMCPVFIKGADGKEKEIWCLIDTGFTGWLCLEDKMAKELGLKNEGVSDMTSASSDFKASTHTSDVRIGGSVFKDVTIHSHPFPHGGRNQYERGIIGILLLSQGKFSIEKNGQDYNYSIKI